MSLWLLGTFAHWPSRSRTRRHGSRCSICSRSLEDVPERTDSCSHRASRRYSDSAPYLYFRHNLSSQIPENDSRSSNINSGNCIVRRSTSVLRCRPDCTLRCSDVLLSPTVGGILSSGMPGFLLKIPLSCSKSVCVDPHSIQSQTLLPHKCQAQPLDVPTVLPASSSPTISRWSSALVNK